MPSDDALILAIDTSAAHCAAALLSGEAPVGARTEPMQRGQAERLLPLCAELLAAAGATWRDLRAVGVCTGPGNFTGLRIAVAAARGLALGLGIPAIGVTRFEALAAAHRGPVLAMLDGGRGGLIVQRLRDGIAEAAPFTCTPEALAGIAPGTLCIGHGAATIAGRLNLAAGSETTAADPVVLARLTRARIGAPQPPPRPLYVRPPDAAPSPPPLRLLVDDA